MKKAYALPATALWCGVTGMGLRGGNLRNGYEAATGLPIPGQVTFWLVWTWLIAAAVCLVFICKKNTAQEKYLENFQAPNTWAQVTTGLSGALLFLSGAYGAQSLAGLNQDTRFSPGLILFTVAAILAGVGMLFLALANGKKFLPKAPLSLLLPGFCGCGWLLCVFQTYSFQPVISSYGILVLAAAATTAACYFLSAFAYDKPRPWAFRWTATVAVVLLFTDLADWRDPMTVSLELGFILFLLTQLYVLDFRQLHPAVLEEPAEATENPEIPEENGGDPQ